METNNSKMTFAQFHDVLAKFVWEFCQEMFPLEKPDALESRDSVVNALKVRLSIDPQQKISRYTDSQYGVASKPTETVVFAPYLVEVTHPVLMSRHRHGGQVPVSGLGVTEEDAVAVCLSEVRLALKKLYDAKEVESDAADAYATSLENASLKTGVDFLTAL